jgi:hypothetical protein
VRAGGGGHSYGFNLLQRNINIALHKLINTKYKSDKSFEASNKPTILILTSILVQYFQNALITLSTTHIQRFDMFRLPGHSQGASAHKIVLSSCTGTLAHATPRLRVTMRLKPIHTFYLCLLENIKYFPVSVIFNFPVPFSQKTVSIIKTHQFMMRNETAVVYC